MSIKRTVRRRGALFAADSPLAFCNSLRVNAASVGKQRNVGRAVHFFDSFLDLR
jgi:hypothetical protein